jgi:putative phosphoribosyl transferase
VIDRNGAAPGSAERLPIPTDGVVLQGVLEVPSRVRGVVVVARGGGTFLHGGALDGRALRRSGLATLLVDLLVAGESTDPRCLLDVFRLARRLEAVTRAVTARSGIGGLPIGYFADGTAAAGALVASLDDPRVAAVVCARGRPDLAQGILGRLTAATLFIVGGDDENASGLEPSALAALRCPWQMTPLDAAGGSRLKAAGRVVTRVARDWFARHIVAPSADRVPGPTAGTSDVAGTKIPARRTARALASATRRASA